jgi:hypothetical protein
LVATAIERDGWGLTAMVKTVMGRVGNGGGGNSAATAAAAVAVWWWR